MSEQTRTILRDFQNGLVMRRANSQDANSISAFNARIHGEDPFDENVVRVWTQDLLTKPHPTFRPDDFVVIEKSDTGEIVSSLNLISQTWLYEGIPFGVGRPELVGTDPNYRGQGLVRAMFDEIHAWSKERGEFVQAITGIPFFYRQFGYEMGLELGGGRVGSFVNVPELKEGQEEPYKIREATENDLAMMMRLTKAGSERSLVNPERDMALWRYELMGKSHDNGNRYDFRVIEDVDGKAVGFFMHIWYAWGDMQALNSLELEKGVSYLAVIPTLIRYLWEIGEENSRARGLVRKTFGFWLGSSHPAYEAAGERLPYTRAPYAYYVRVPDVPAFLRHIRPALEERLAKSVCAGHTGELKISFYRDGVRLVIEKGRLTAVEDWKPKVREDEGNVFFPNQTFFNVLFGYKSIAELRNIYADCYANGDARVLMGALFPKKPSDVWPIS